ncbi:unnamed protein product [Tuber melanosporum]|uniref:(Perigord truffle) hypothetical protein n=1 Tax=Tuber melanosporum (strain Mel28) TaxID=656061 RepID=D5GAH7_TUBMM|nr:uncharacterized protein GSTUM_00003592001 [Tuber melanosporum]CAZ81520.1 unnamed protein product [Tuber melanosporum]
MHELSNWGHVVLIWTLVLVLYIVLGLRTWALRNTNYSMFSPRGISTLCIALTVALTTAVCAVVTWSLVGPMHGVPKRVLTSLYNPDLPESGDIFFGPDPRAPLETVFKVNFGSMILFYVVLWLIKVSFVVIYFEFSKDLSRQTRTLLYITIAAVAVTFVFVICLYSLWCLPVSANWAFNDLVQSGTCRASLAPSVIISVINVLVDILIMVAGFSIVRSLNLGRSNFRSASLIIAVGILTVVVAFIRMIVLVVRMKNRDRAYDGIYNDAVHDKDTMNVYVPIQESVVGYAEVEAILACIAACLPGIRVLFRKHISRRSELTFKDCGSAGTLTPPASPPTACPSPPTSHLPFIPATPPPVYQQKVRVEEMV